MPWSGLAIVYPPTLKSISSGKCIGMLRGQHVFFSTCGILMKKEYEVNRQILNAIPIWLINLSGWVFLLPVYCNKSWSYDNSDDIKSI